jgi:hypothetical protein
MGGGTPTKDMVYKAILSNRTLLESEKMSMARITKDMKTLRLKGAASLEKQHEECQVVIIVIQ